MAICVGAAGSRVPALILILLGGPLAGPSPVQAEPLAAADKAELQRGLALVGPSTSEEPAVRRERQAREPSAAFMLGAALGAWRNASATLRYDLETPSGDGDDTEAIAIDCYDDRMAFDHLEARSQVMGLTPSEVVDDAGASNRPLLEAWLARRSGQPSRCR